MGDGLPGYTCPTIDRVKRTLRRLRDGGEVDPVEIGAALRDLEEVREANHQLREGYAKAAAPCGNKCRRR